MLRHVGKIGIRGRRASPKNGCALTGGTSLERIGDESLTRSRSRFDLHKMLRTGRESQPHAESPAEDSRHIMEPALTFAGTGRRRPPAVAEKRNQDSEFIGVFLTPSLPIRSANVLPVNEPTKDGTNRRRISDSPMFPFRSIPDVVVEAVIHNSPQAAQDESPERFRPDVNH